MLPIALIVAAPPAARAQDTAPEPASLGAPLTIAIFLLAIGILVWLWKRDTIRPGSFRRRPGAQAPLARAAVPLFLLMLACILASSLAALAATSALGLAPDAPRTVRDMALITLAAAPAGLACAIIALHLARRLDPILRFRLRPDGFILGLLLALLVFPITLAVGSISLWIAALLGAPPPGPVAHGTLEAILSPEAGAWRWVLIAGAVVATPIYEEILFRGLLQSALAAALPWRWAAVLLATALFTLVHVSGGIDAHSLPAVATIGLAMGIAYERTGKIAVPIGMHAAFNAANVALALAM